jgi:hypothetical protein
MAVLRLVTWVANDILTASDLNGEFDNILNQGQAVGFPRTANADFNGYTLILDADADTTLRASTDDQIDIAIGGTDTYSFTATELTILGKRVLTVDDRLKILGQTASLMQFGTLSARVSSLESDAVTMAQLNNF